MARKVVVIDDSRTARMLVRKALGNAYSVVEACDGAEGLAKVRENADAALVLCDVNMPNMSGMEMLAHLHADGAKVPVIMITTEAMPELIQQGSAHGAKGWLVKPFQAPALLQAVEKVLGPEAS